MYKYLILIACGMFFYSCSEENNREPVTSDSNVPGQVSNVRVECFPGAVKLTYDMPGGQSLSYVKAECEINGTVRQAKSSSYVNHLTLEGFADTSVYTINLYSVNRSEIASEPVTIQAKPLLPSFLDVFNNIQLFDDWGGATVLFENPSEADLAITVIHVDSTGFWNEGETLFTNKNQGSFSLRGMPAKETTFGVYIRDRWNNTSDTLVKVLVPFFEKQLDRTKFREVRLPTDTSNDPGQPEWTMPNIWDGNIAQKNTNQWGGFLTATNAVLPNWFTFDMGAVEGAKLSRFRLWHRNTTTYAYYQRNIKKFELYGSMNPNPDGSWDDSWTLLLDEEVIKPSGLPLGQATVEDLETVNEGIEFSFPLDVPFVRYIRMKVTENFVGTGGFYVMQLVFWGMEPSDIE